MTREEAIKWLIRPTITTTGEAEGMQKKQLDAYYMAIEALQEKEMYDNIPNSLLTKDEKKALSDQCAKSECGRMTDEDSGYCPNCGARMASK